jgi:hypothetical protein
MISLRYTGTLLVWWLDVGTDKLLMKYILVNGDHLDLYATYIGLQVGVSVIGLWSPRLVFNRKLVKMT